MTKSIPVPPHNSNWPVCSLVRHLVPGVERALLALEGGPQLVHALRPVHGAVHGAHEQLAQLLRGAESPVVGTGAGRRPSDGLEHR